MIIRALLQACLKARRDPERFAANCLFCVGAAFRVHLYDVWKKPAIALLCQGGARKPRRVGFDISMLGL
jgi:hypothetical protein